MYAFFHTHQTRPPGAVRVGSNGVHHHIAGPTGAVAPNQQVAKAYVEERCAVRLLKVLELLEQKKHRDGTSYNFRFALAPI